MLDRKRSSAAWFARLVHLLHVTRYLIQMTAQRLESRIYAGQTVKGQGVLVQLRVHEPVSLVSGRARMVPPMVGAYKGQVICKCYLVALSLGCPVPVIYCVDESARLLNLT
jgi:hypothetical protein